MPFILLNSIVQRIRCFFSRSTNVKSHLNTCFRFFIIVPIRLAYGRQYKIAPFYLKIVQEVAELSSLSKYCLPWTYLGVCFNYIKKFHQYNRMRIQITHADSNYNQLHNITFNFTGTGKYKVIQNKTFKMAKAIINLITFYVFATYLLHGIL